MDLSRQLKALAVRVSIIEAEIEALQRRLIEAFDGAHPSSGVAHDERRTMEDLDARGQVERDLITLLQAEVVLSREQTRNLQIALRSSRTIGAAIGIVMATRRVTEAAAFDILTRASQQSNRKVRLVADDVVRTGDVGTLPT